MKKTNRNHSAVISEVAHQIGYSLKVLMIGLFIPVAFLFGISYNTSTAKQAVKVKVEQQVASFHLPSLDQQRELMDQKCLILL